MTLHSSPARLFCHHCGKNKFPPKICEQCKQCSLSPMGIGTERLEEILAEYFPQMVIERLDRDSVSRRGERERKLTRIRDGEAQIIVGTQMVAKGHHFPRLGMVAIIDADTGLYSSDFRALERLGQLVTQVAGRAGREDISGSVYIQTHAPEHPLWNDILQGKYEVFLRKELEQRVLLNLPPAGYLALWRAEAKEAARVVEFLEGIKKEIEQKITGSAVVVSGPIPALMERKAGVFRYQLLLKSKQRGILQTVLARVIPDSKVRIRWSIDVDPQDLA
jgi:primosomal protein N' (replication factor Y)